MRILQISSAMSFGGGEKHFVDLCRGLAESGDEVHAAVRPGCEWISRIDFIRGERINRIRLRNAADLISAAKVARIIRKNGIDIVHAHLARDYPLAALAVRQATGTKLVLTRHVMFPLKNIHKLLLKNVSAVIAVSDAAAGGLRKVFPDDKIVRVYNGLDPVTLEDPEESAREFRFENNISYDEKVVTSVGTLTRLKGQKDLITAAADVIAAHPEAYFVFVGKDQTKDARYLHELEKHAGDLGIKERILIRDWVDDLAPLLAATDIFVSSSRSESFGLAVLEAMAHGKPVVATATDGAKELISDGDTGLLVPIGDPGAMADALNKFLENGQLAKKLAGNAAETARVRFGLKRMIAETRAVYVEVLNK